MLPTKPAAYTALVTALCDNNPWGFRKASDLDLDAGRLNVVLEAYPDLAEDTITACARNIASDVTDELGRNLSPVQEGAALGDLIRTYLRNAAEDLVFEDVRELIAERDEAACEEADSAELA